MSRRELDQLYREHRNICELLDILERQFDSLARGGSPDWEILSGLLEYLVEHPDSGHDRFEAQLLERLAQRAPSCSDLSHTLLESHRTLMANGRQLRRLVERAMNNEVMPRASITRLGHRFIREYRLLIVREHEQLFPALAQHLRESDWVELVTGRYWVGDLHGPPQTRYESEYESLCRSIVQQAGTSWSSIGADSTDCPVCNAE